MKYAYITSCTHAESLGIKFVDSIYKTVVDVEQCRKGNYVIVGYSQGHTYSERDNVKHVANKTYLCIILSQDADNENYDVEITAINLRVAKMILKRDWRDGTQIQIYRKRLATFVQDYEVA
jgi:hypothetical protein